MLKNFTILIFVLIAAVAAVKAQKADRKAADETAIRANVEQMVKGWNAKSGTEFAKPFAENSDYVVINGIHLKGRTENEKSHQQIFDTFYKNSTLSYTIEQIRFLRPDVALVHVNGLLKVSSEKQSYERNGRITMVMTKTGNKWEIAAFQNTQVQEMGESSK